MEKMEELTVQLADGTTCKAISANLLCQAGIYASTLYGTQGGNNARTHTRAQMIVLTLGAHPERCCECVCVCSCAHIRVFWDRDGCD